MAIAVCLATTQRTVLLLSGSNAKDIRYVLYVYPPSFLLQFVQPNLTSVLVLFLSDEAQEGWKAQQPHRLADGCS